MVQPLESDRIKRGCFLGWGKRFRDTEKRSDVGCYRKRVSWHGVCELVIELLQDQGIKDELAPVSGWGCFVFVRDMMHWVRGLVRRYLYHVQQLHGAYTQ